MKHSRYPGDNKAIVATAAALTTGAYLLAASSIAMGEQAVVARGIQIDYGETQNRSISGPAGATQFSLDDLCRESYNPNLIAQMEQFVSTVETAMTTPGLPISLPFAAGLAGAPNRVDIERDLSEARDEFCDNSVSPATSESFVITYSSCRMVMYTPTDAMTIFIPPGTNTANMHAYDHSKGEVVSMNLTGELNATAAVVGSGWANVETDYTPTGATDVHAGYPTAEYAFSHTGGLGEAGMGALNGADVSSGAVTSPQQLGNLVSVKSTGTAWISERAPGSEIVESFYQNLIRSVDANQNNSFFSGMIKNQVGMLSRGMPMVVDETTSSTVMGRTMGNGRTKSVITGINVVELAPDWCGDRPLPEGYTLTDMNQQLSDAMSGGSGPSSGEYASAMQEYQQAMEQLTPEQKAMMAQLGMGSGMPGATNAPGAASPTLGNAGAPATAAPAVSAANTTLPSSAALTTDNLMESVQRHLDALGYDAGNTNGESSVMTSIAISQFQAERGMEVTGEVSPQLLGILSAEVDR